MRTLKRLGRRFARLIGIALPEIVSCLLLLVVAPYVISLVPISGPDDIVLFYLVAALLCVPFYYLRGRPRMWTHFLLQLFVMPAPVFYGPDYTIGMPYIAMDAAIWVCAAYHLLFYLRKRFRKKPQQEQGDEINEQH